MWKEGNVLFNNTKRSPQYEALHRCGASPNVLWLVVAPRRTPALAFVNPCVHCKPKSVALLIGTHLFGGNRYWVEVPPSVSQNTSSSLNDMITIGKAANINGPKTTAFFLLSLPQQLRCTICCIFLTGPCWYRLPRKHPEGAWRPCGDEEAWYFIKLTDRWVIPGGMVFASPTNS